MSVVHFTSADRARTRFAISPIWETVLSWGVHKRPQRSPHRTWVTAAARAAGRASFAEHATLLDALVGPHARLPAFLTPPPGTAAPDFTAELEVLATTPPAEVHADVEATEGRRPTRLARSVAEDPEAWLPRVVEAVHAWHRLAIAPHWGRMQTVLEADIAHRAAVLAEHGPGAMFESIDDSLTWAEDLLRVADGADLDVRLSGQGMPLLPCIFSTRGPGLTVRPGSAPLLVYRARAAGTLWQPRRRPPANAALGALLGPSRARVLALLDAPATTTGVATRLGAGAPTVNAHLKVLTEAGLASRHRHGREVFYVVTDLGRRLLAINREGRPGSGRPLR